MDLIPDRLELAVIAAADDVKRAAQQLRDTAAVLETVLQRIDRIGALLETVLQRALQPPPT